MLRAYNNLPSIASPAISICALKLSLRQALNSTSSSSSRRISTTFPLLSQTFTSSTSFLGLKRVMRMRNRPPLRASASYSTGNSHDVGREILVQHLLLKEEDKNIFLELQKRLVQGEDLSDLAVEYSICPSKEEGGMLGWVRKGQMVPEFEEAAFNAPVNKVVKCKTQFGWHLLQVLSEREESVLQDIQPEELHTKLQDPDFLEDAQFIDVREPHEVVIMECGRCKLPNGCRHRGLGKYTTFLVESMHMQSRLIPRYPHTEHQADCCLPFCDF
ncbi:rhodanese-like/PpiC domain-containing protein 12, chloroplastic isoform X4 [Cynara cardunculus var. scolymus]|uniref:rhodanese-like/PpiC domain-containing protein 12, chloroplastic isoform X4 n=1 Tax=Cynara cardunculus var. scolymus TaxID=59895 RepID=UPI000D62A446|nr:rhodanese-like/PpiC domain-containing protein 12, chloroplastic isoform X4 [Cynara cardunculus var. scolymus]